MATIGELEERVRNMENILTLFSRDIFEQFDLKIKAAETSLAREIEAKIDGMFEKSREKHKNNTLIELRKGIDIIKADLKDLEMR